MVNPMQRSRERYREPKVAASGIGAGTRPGHCSSAAQPRRETVHSRTHTALGPLWVISGHTDKSASCLLYPQSRTQGGEVSIWLSVYEFTA